MPIFFVLEIEEGGGVTDTLQGTLSSVEAELEGMDPGDVRLIKCVEMSQDEFDALPVQETQTSEYPEPMAQFGNWIDHRALIDPAFADLDIMEQLAEYGRECDADRLTVPMEI